MPQNNVNTRDRISLENRLSTVETIVEEIRSNHLPHIEEKVDRLLWLLITTAIGVAASLILRFV